MLITQQCAKISGVSGIKKLKLIFVRNNAQKCTKLLFKKTEIRKGLFILSNGVVVDELS